MTPSFHGTPPHHATLKITHYLKTESTTGTNIYYEYSKIDHLLEFGEEKVLQYHYSNVNTLEDFNPRNLTLLYGRKVGNRTCLYAGNVRFSFVFFWYGSL